ncbi:MAG: c-type cytochrome [Candidatus Nitrohelix vancouverensis]|uniref:C-type cytochrome n=1 Tax=Candidatus Nitrohelix vancouverensis TaxID=2705534 RepID=A0A7T0C584_9BACT|nr:MAG: c-type cytochrome [Candidatus Nitrohelix vancouverensis]
MHEGGMDHKHHQVRESVESAIPDAGDQYRIQEPQDHDMHHMHGGEPEPGDLFRTRGMHDLKSLQPRQEDSGALKARGKAIYLHMCVFCHGEDGNGGGKAVSYLFPWPRDFRKGIFKFRSTPTGSLPRDEDLYRTIINGVPGTSMPAWGDALSPEDTWALVDMIKGFSTRFQEEQAGDPVDIGSPPPSTPEIVARGKVLWSEQKCINCHGASGQGDGKVADSLIDAWNHAVFVHDITRPALFKVGFQPADIYRTLSAGFDGTPMESFAHLPEEDRWALVHFIRSRFRGGLTKAEFETDLYSYRVDVELDTAPDSPVWDGVETKELVLRPLSARRGAVETINFASVNNGEYLAIRLKWLDPTKDAFSEKTQDVFRDGSAVQFALGATTLHTHGHNEPFFGMGNRNKPVNIWHWRAGLEEALEAEDDMEYSTGGVDMDALIFGGLMSNPVARLNPTGENAVEELNAEGFGTITPQPQERQNVEGYGTWKDGEWTVVFLRQMTKDGKWDVELIRDQPALVALAVWDGLKEDRNGRKVISVWQRLNILNEKK